MKKHTKETFILTIMQSGFERAASALSRIIEKPVDVSHVESLRFPDSTLVLAPKSEEDIVVLTTQLIGEVPGKSYLIFNDHESAEIRSVMQQPNAALHDASLLEIDNILSAAVISDLSNALAAEVYGDVPQLVKIPAQQLKEFFQTDIMTSDSSQYFFTKATFLINNKEKIHPQFIWKLSTKIFDMIAV